MAEEGATLSFNGDKGGGAKEQKKKNRHAPKGKGREKKKGKDRISEFKKKRLQSTASKPCRYKFESKCPWGEGCRFQHKVDTDEAPPPPSRECELCKKPHPYERCHLYKKVLRLQGKRENKRADRHKELARRVNALEKGEEILKEV